MKKNTLTVVGFLFFVLGTNHIMAQEYKPSAQEVKKHTVMEMYEPDLVLSVAERKQLKEKRENSIALRKRILDTLDISERRRERLLKVLNKNPFSNEMNKAMADIDFIEEEQ
ncbi:hypothetical protein [Maribacter polysiphoniae]|uniref:hypothetical protein n=1 Tax=Maribacter polysiphoniae TaxID=429344 RepID=UPI0023569B65|nr:hypothetical protein [Maribacter polysiphoniae]